MSRNERIEEVKKTYYNIDVDKFKTLLDSYGVICLSREQYLYKVQFDKMDEVTTYLSSIKTNSLDDANKVVKIMGQIYKAWEGLDKARSRMFDADSKINVRGGTKESYREKKSRQ